MKMRGVKHNVTNEVRHSNESANPTAKPRVDTAFITVPIGCPDA